MRYYIIRREEPFEKGTEELKYSFYGDEDDFTLGAKMVFLGLVYKFISSDIMSFNGETLLNFDVVKDINSLCYIRDQIIQPGSMTDTWREPTKYSFYYEDGGYYQLKQLEPYNTKIKYIKDKPKYIIYRKVLTDNLYNSFITGPAYDNGKEHYVICVPKGTIKNNYYLDTK